MHVGCALIALFVFQVSHWLTPVPDARRAKQTWDYLDLGVVIFAFGRVDRPFLFGRISPLVGGQRSLPGLWSVVQNRKRRARPRQTVPLLAHVDHPL